MNKRTRTALVATLAVGLGAVSAMAADDATRETEGSPPGSGDGLAFAQADKDDYTAQGGGDSGPSDHDDDDDDDEGDDDDDKNKGKGKDEGKDKPQSPGNGDGGTDDPAIDDPHGEAPVDNRPAPAPALGRSVVVEPASGVVLVRRPGSSGFVALKGDAKLPVGSVIDATRGHVALSSALGADGKTQTGTFWGGAFKVHQSRTGNGVTKLVLTGGRLDRCGPAARGVPAAVASMASETARTRRRPPRRQLWGRDSGGRFHTHGHDSVAAVRGTRWLTRDTCAGTLTRVTEGEVVVRDKRTKKSIVLKAGQSYLARANGRPATASA